MIEYMIWPLLANLHLWITLQTLADNKELKKKQTLQTIKNTSVRRAWWRKDTSLAWQTTPAHWQLQSFDSFIICFRINSIDDML